ncbi:MAG: hypothetical protein ACQCN3_08880 [Candidatus Bathyarchaeia archaeon]|jgi:hypothetical protein
MSKTSLKQILHILCLNVLLTTVIVGATSVNTVEAQTPYPCWVSWVNIVDPPASNVEPYGRLNIIVDMFKLKYDGTSEYDWYYYAGSSSGMRLETVPGCSIWDNSPWKNYKLGAAFYVESPGTYRWLDDYDNPDTVDGWGSASASASCQIGPFGSSYSYSYNIPYMTVVNYGQLDLHKAAWLSTHNVLLVADDPSCTNAFMNRPSFVVRTTQNTWSWVNAQFMVQWALRTGGLQTVIPSQEFWTSYIDMDAYHYGDSW